MCALTQVTAKSPVSLSTKRFQKVSRLVIASNRLRRGSMQADAARMASFESGASSAPQLRRGMSRGPGHLSRQQSMVGIPARHLPTELSDEELERALGVKAAMDANEWDADVLALCRVLEGPMSYVVSRVLKKHGASSVLGVSEDKIMSLLLELEVGMPRRNAYHNNLHVADVAYTTHLMLEHGVKAAAQLTQLQCVTALLAAATHDLRHPGVNNNWLMASRDEVAIVYNDRSVLENYHVAEFFRLVARPELNVFCARRLQRRIQRRIQRRLCRLCRLSPLAASRLANLVVAHSPRTSCPSVCAQRNRRTPTRHVHPRGGAQVTSAVLSTSRFARR